MLCPASNLRFVPQADSYTAQVFVSLDHLVGARLGSVAGNAKLFCRLEIYYQFELGRLPTCSSEGFSPFNIWPT